MIPTVVVGAGGHGQDLRAIIDATTTHRFVGYLDDRKNHAEIVGRVYEADSLARDVRYVIGVNDPNVRHGLAQRLRLERATALVHPRAWVGPGCNIAKGAVVAAGAILDRDVFVGWHTHVHTGVSLTRSWLLPYSTLCPNSTVAGDCVIGRRVLVGAGATVRNLTYIADDVTIGAGAAVVDHVRTSGTYLGVPAKAAA